MSSFVLDCSVTMAWGFKEEATPYTNVIRESLSEYRALVPAIWLLEVANVLLVSERKNKFTESDSREFLNILRTFPILVDNNTSDIIQNKILELARNNHLTSYDASYLELAIRYRIPLATLDKKLKQAAIQNEVKIYQEEVMRQSNP